MSDPILFEKYEIIRKAIIDIHDKVINPTYATIKEHIQKSGVDLNAEQISEVMTQLIQNGAVNNVWYIQGTNNDVH